MAEQRHGRYYAQELMMNEGTNVREQIQNALDAVEEQEWHLVGVLRRAARTRRDPLLGHLQAQLRQDLSIAVRA